MPAIDFQSFPTTRYQGSKRKILPWIYENLRDIRFNTVLDACGGSASVSYLFKRMGKSVTYNDKLRFNYHIGLALIQNQNTRFTPENLTNLYESVEAMPGGNFIEETFSGIYYWRRENEWLDKINNGIINMNHYTGQTLRYKKAIVYYALYQACMIKRPFNLFHRRNLGIRSKNVDRNFGNKATWDKTFEHYLGHFIDEANSLIFDSGVRCFATNNSLFDIQNVDYDLVYIDPPYLNMEGTNETSNYLKCYHFLEGMANYEQWNDLIDFDTINLRFKNVNTENDFQKDNIIESFDRIFYTFRDSKIVLSYKKGGTPAIETLVKLMRQYKRNVTTRSMHYKYALNGQNGDAVRNREVLIIGV